MKTRIFIAVGSLVLAFSAAADDQLRKVQTELKGQGFYYGDVDGQASGETTSAIRRYQIRNGLEVTGTLNPETLGALGIGSGHSKAANAAQPFAKSKATPPVNIRRDESVEDSDRNFLRREEGKDPHREFFDPALAPHDTPPPNVSRDLSAIPPSRSPSVTPAPHDSFVAPVPYVAPVPRDSYPAPGSRDPYAGPAQRDPAFVAPPAPLDAPSADFPVLFAGTPYASAPLVVQQQTLRRAQMILGNRGFYRDIVDGLPGPATEEALLTFQRAARLTLTGRLDVPTLSELHMLPGNAGVEFGFEYRGPRRVYRGVWADRW